MQEIKFKNITLFYRKEGSKITINYSRLFKHLTGIENKFMEFVKYDFFANFVYNQMKIKNKKYNYTIFKDLMEVVNETNGLFYENYSAQTYEGIYGPIEMLPMVLILYSPELLAELNSKLIDEFKSNVNF